MYFLINHPYIILFFTSLILISSEVLIIKFDLIEKSKQNIFISTFYLISGLLFSFYIYFLFGKKEFFNYLAGYSIETMLSLDNLVFIMLIFKSLNIQDAISKKRVLLIGLISMFILRFAFIGAGLKIMQISWITVVAAIFIMILGLKLLFYPSQKNVDITNNSFYIKLSEKLDLQQNQTKFFVFINQNNNTSWSLSNLKNLRITTLFACLVIIEVADIIFALDSVPAILLLTQNIFVAYSANVFSVLGLRSFYNIMEIFFTKLKYINKIIGAVLVALAAKIII